MDMTVHPVIELKVGEYKDNQDVHIFKSLRGKDFDASEYLNASVGNCSDGSDETRINPLIKKVWSQSLISTFPELDEQNDPPDIDAWHNDWLDRN